ncbi:MAG: tetratricopeptide repeat protein [Bacteroidetes bacterium]|nr:tetratricopeptide repeat protein [Bacteroidota bacterium]
MKEQRLQKLLQMQAENAEDTFVNYAIGLEYLGSADLVAAEAWFKKVLELDPKHIPAKYQLALLLFTYGKAAEASSILEAGLNQLKDSKDLKTRNEFQSLWDEINY